MIIKIEIDFKKIFWRIKCWATRKKYCPHCKGVCEREGDVYDEDDEQDFKLSKLNSHLDGLNEETRAMFKRIKFDNNKPF